MDDLFTRISVLIVSGARALRFFIRDTQSILKAAAIRARWPALRATLVEGLVVLKSIVALGSLFFDTHTILELCSLTTCGRIVTHTSSSAVLFVVWAARRLWGHTNVASLLESVLAFRLLLRHTVTASQHGAMVTNWLFDRDAELSMKFLPVIADGLCARDTPVTLANGLLRALRSGQDTRVPIELGSIRTTPGASARHVLGWFDMVDIPYGWVLAGRCHRALLRNTGGNGQEQRKAARLNEHIDKKLSSKYLRKRREFVKMQKSKV